jgi:DNA-binding transcriptional regulator YhcF (GntR family)
MTQILSAPPGDNGNGRDLCAQPGFENLTQTRYTRASANRHSIKTDSSQRYKLPDDGPGYLYEIVANHLTMRIADGYLAPNMTLPAEGMLAREYGVSLGTARHASRLLCDRGLLVTVKSKGNYISTIAPLAAKELVEHTKDEIAMEQARLTQVIE